uniref:VWFD domain-containing protein n=1 Tax=Mesocestoides corti TaxID=53468 RepID=A0A5K3FP87_MESCO
MRYAKCMQVMSFHQKMTGTMWTSDRIVTMACYLRIDFPAKLSSANMAVNGTLGNHTVATVIKLSSSSNAYLGISPSKDDMSLSNVGPSVIETKTNGHETLRLRFCTKPGVYLDDLRLEANTESYTYEDEILNIKRLSYDAPTNYPGLHCATRKPASYRRKPNGQIWHLGISLGPVFNSGFAYWADLRKPEPDADCLALTVEVQLTGGERVEDKTMRHVVVKSIANNKVTLASRIVIVLKDHHNAFLDVNLGLMSQLSVNAGEFFMDIHANLSEQSTLECRRASFWLMHGGIFEVNVVSVKFNDARVKLVSLSNGRGLKVFEGDLRFGVTGVIRLVLKSLPNVMVKRDVNIDVGGILKCNTQDNSKPIFNPPVYFSQTARLVAAAGEHLGNPNYLRLKPCQVRVFGAPGDFGDILLHSDATRYWTTHARGGYYKAFRSVTVLFGRVFHISDITLKLKENANNTPRSLDLDGTRDGKSFFFLRKVGVAFQSNSLETNITLTNLPGVRGLRLTLRDLLYDDEVVHIKMGFFGSLESQAQNDFDPCEAQTTSSTDGQCASSVALRSYVSGPDFIVYCDQIPDVAVDYQIRSVWMVASRKWYRTFRKRMCCWPRQAVRKSTF